MKLRFRRLMRKISEAFNLVLLFALLGGGLFATGYLFPKESLQLAGRARASDGDSIRIGDQRVRLLGIDAPELDQTCIDATGKEWMCGRISKDRMNQLLASGNVDCSFENWDKYGRALAICQVNGDDIGAIMVSEGLAISYNDYPAEEALAHAQKLGLWSGEFITPRAWRDGVRQSEPTPNIFQGILDWFTR